MDELDRCAPAATMSTLEGLRRFVGEDNCIFVVAFDRESVVATVEDEMLRTVPHRPGRPYYSTAGEYLDKIFTYQVALPPQPRKGFRKYARDLVADKQGGVWGELRTQYGQEALDRVISILSPPHLTSPRRTKVILNDFAINARMVHSFRNSWTERADEIAVLTVLQTEFPLFYADLEHYPSLLAHVAKRVATEPGETIAPLVRQYTEKRAAYDTVFTSGREAVPSGSDGTPSSPKTSPPNNAVSIALGQQLERYLEKLRDMQATLPMADLIQLGTGERMLQFENPAVFAAVEAATEVPRTETLALLEKASSNDRYRAVEMMLNSIEGEPSAEAMSLRGLSGVLLPSLDEGHRRALLTQVAGSWDRIVAADAMLRLGEPAVVGYVQALAPAKDHQWVNEVIRTTYPNPPLLARALSAIAELAPAPTLGAARRELLDNAIAVVRDDPKVFESLVRRLDEGPGADLGLAEAKKLAEMLSTPDIPDDDLERLDGVGVATLSILRLHAAVTTTSTRRWLAKVFRLRAIDDAGAIPNYLRVLGTSLRWETTRADAVDELLEALAVKASPDFKSAVAKYLPSDGVAPSTKLLIPALHALLRIVAKDDLKDPTTAVNGISAIVTLLPEGFAVAEEPILKIVQGAYRGHEIISPAGFDALVAAAYALSRVPALRHTMYDLSATLIAGTAGDERSQSHSASAISALETQPPEVLLRVATSLREGHGERRATSLEAVEMILFAQQQLRQLGRKVKTLTFEEVFPYPAYLSANLISHWIATAPLVDDIRAALDGGELTSVSAEVWKVYAQRAPLIDRSRVWEMAVARGGVADTLRAIASRGIDQRIVAEAAKNITVAPDTDSRRSAVQVYLTLPRHVIVATALVEPLAALLKHPSRTDAPLIAELLIHFAKAFDDDASARLYTSVKDWIAHARLELPESTAKKLLRSRWVRPALEVRERQTE